MPAPAPLALLFRVTTNTLALFSGLLLSLGIAFLLCTLLQDLELRLLSANRKHHRRRSPSASQARSDTTDTSSSAPPSNAGPVPKLEDTVIHHVRIFALLFTLLGYVICLVAACVDYSSLLKTVLNSTICTVGAAIGQAIPVGLLFVAIGVYAREDDWMLVWRRDGLKGVERRIGEVFADVGGWIGELAPREDREWRI